MMKTSSLPKLSTIFYYLGEWCSNTYVEKISYSGVGKTS